MPIERKERESDGKSITQFETAVRPVMSPQKPLPFNQYGKKKRTIVERERDIADVTNLYLMGYTQAQITDIVNEMGSREYQISREMIHQDVQMILKRWHERYVENIQAATVMLLSQIDKIEHNYWQGWERSMADIEEEEQHRTDDEVAYVSGREGQKEKGKKVPSYTRKREVKRKKSRDGNVKFLTGIQWCIEQRMKILGVGTTKKVSISWRKQAEDAGVDPDKILDELTEKYLTDGQSPDPSDSSGFAGVVGRSG